MTLDEMMKTVAAAQSDIEIVADDLDAVNCNHAHLEDVNTAYLEQAIARLVILRERLRAS